MVSERYINSENIWLYAHAVYNGDTSTENTFDEVLSLQWWHDHNDDLQWKCAEYGDDTVNEEVYKIVKGVFTNSSAYKEFQRKPCLERWLQEHDGYVIKMNGKIAMDRWQDGDWVLYDENKSVNMHHVDYKRFFCLPDVMYEDIQFVTHRSHEKGNYGAVPMPPLPQDGDVVWVDDLDAVIDSAKEIAQRLPTTGLEARVSAIEECLVDLHDVMQKNLEKMTGVAL